MNTCTENYKTCGHCKVCFDGPPGYEARPYCDKVGLFRMLTGNDSCPNAPWPEEQPDKPWPEVRPKEPDPHAREVDKLRDPLADEDQPCHWMQGQCMFCSAVNKARRVLGFRAELNKDRFLTDLDAQIAFLNEAWLISVDKETMLERDKIENWTDHMKSAYYDWLFTPTKKEVYDRR